MHFKEPLRYGETPQWSVVYPTETCSGDIGGSEKHGL